MAHKLKISHSKNTARMIGYQLRLIRIEYGLSGLQLGRIMGISQQQVSRYEHGLTSMSIDSLVLLCNYFNVKPDYFLAPIFNDNNYLTETLKVIK